MIEVIDMLSVCWLLQDKLDIQKTLEEEARKCQWLILWLDCDREGENIAFEVVESCVRANRNLNIRRARFSALTERFSLLDIFYGYLFCLVFLYFAYAK